MANIDNLNFKVILDDKDFNRQIKADMDAARELNKSLSEILNLKNKLNKETTSQLVNAEKVRQAEQKTAQEMAKTALQQQKVRSEVEKTRMAQNGFNTSLSTSAGLMRTLANLTGVTFSVVGLRRFLSSLVDITGQFEVQKMALRNMLQDIDGANKIFEDLYNFSSKSTYRFSELAKYAKQLAAFNIEQGNLLETTKMLGDVASGVGVSMDRLILAYGHVKSSGFLRGIQLRSFSQNGVPILEELAKMFTELEGKAVSLGDVFDKMTKRQIGFDMVEEAFRRMTSEGGKFYQMQEVLAKTLSGQINILKGKWENLMYAMGESQEGVLKGVVAALTNIVSNMENFGKAMGEAVAVFGAYRVAVIATTAVTEGLAAAINTSLVGRALKNLFALLAKNPYAILAAAVTYAIYEIVKANKAISDTEKITKALIDTTDKFNKAQADEIRELDILIGRLKSAHEGTEEYAAAKRALESRFDPYIRQLREEGVAVNDLSALYDGLARKITEANKQRFLEQAQDSIVEKYHEATDNIKRETDALIDKLSRDLGRVLSGDELGAIQHYVDTGEKNAIFRALGLDRKSKTQAAGLFGQTLEIEGDSYSNLFRDLMNRNVLAAETYADSMTEAAKRFDAANDRIAGSEKNAVASLSGWRKSVADAISGMDQKTLQETGLTPKDDEDYYEYLERIGKKYKELNEEKDKALRVDKSQYAGWLNSIRAVDKALEGNILSDARYNKTPWKGSDSEESNKRIKSLKAEISILEKYREAREKLEPFFGGETDSQLAKIFGSSQDYSDLDADIAKLCERLRELGKEGTEAAEQIETRLGLDKISNIIKAQKALKKWQETLSKWMKDWGGGDYHGIEGDIDKVVREYNNEDNKITQDYLDALNEIMDAHWGDVDAINAEIAALDKLVASRRAANATEQQEKLNDLASKYVKDKTRNLNLRDWGDKSIGQVREIYRALTELANGEVVLDETMTGRLQRAGLAIEDFSKLAKEEFEQLSENAKQELGKKLANTIKGIASELNTVVGAVKEFADASGNSALSSAMENFSFALGSIGQFAEKAATGDWIGAIVGYAASLATAFFQAQAAVAQFQASLREAREEARRAGLSDMLDTGVDSVFGTNEMAKVRNAVAIMQKARASMNAAVMPSTFRRNGTIWDALGMTGRRLSYNGLAEMAESVGRDLYDAYGNLNAETLKAILETYDDLGQAEQEWITRAINDSEAYAEAMEQVKDVTQDIFGGIASSSSDIIVEQWKERRDAALDYADVLDDVATRYAKMLVESMIYDQVLNEDEAKLVTDLFAKGDREGAMARIAEDMEKIRAMEPALTDILQSFDPYFNRDGGDGSDTLRSGIQKALVEQNSTLIASYMNAIRADVSVIRGMQAMGWQDVRAIHEALQLRVVPNYQEYMAKIAADTHDMNLRQQAMLEKVSRLAGTVTQSTNGGSAIRTTK